MTHVAVRSPVHVFTRVTVNCAKGFISEVYKLQTYTDLQLHLKGHHGAAPRGNSQSSHVCGERKGEWVLVPAPARTTTLDSTPWTDVYLSIFALLP